MKTQTAEVPVPQTHYLLPGVPSIQVTAAPSPFPLLPYLICGLLWFGDLTLVFSWGAYIAGPALGCLHCLHTQGGHAVNVSCLPPRCWQGYPDTPREQVFPPCPSQSEPSVCGRRGGGFPSLSIISTRLLAPLGCTPTPAANSAMNGSHSLPKLQLATTVHPGKRDLSLPQACKHQSHTHSRAPAANKSWSMVLLKRQSP